MRPEWSHLQLNLAYFKSTANFDVTLLYVFGRIAGVVIEMKQVYCLENHPHVLWEMCDGKWQNEQNNNARWKIKTQK